MVKQSRQGLQSLVPVTAVPVLLTRPLAQATRFADQLIARFGPRVTPIISPLMRTTYVDATFPDVACSAVIFTSEAGVAAAQRFQIAGKTLPLKAFCVGAQTAKAAAMLGFDARSADGDAVALIALIRDDLPTAPLLHLHGRNTRGNVAETLTLAGLKTFSVVVYDQTSQPLSGAAIAALTASNPVVIPLFSPRSAALLAASVSLPCRSPLLIAAMSRAVADAAAPLLPTALHIATTPDAEGMLAATEVLLTLAGAP